MFRTVSEWIAFVYCFFAVCADLRSWHIPNRLVIWGSISAWILQAAGTAAHCPGAGFGEALSGGLLPLVFPGLLFIPGLLGAGDIKLLCMLGMYLGPSAVWRVTIGSFLTGGGFAVIILAVRKDRHARMHFSLPILAALVLRMQRMI